MNAGRSFSPATPPSIATATEAAGLAAHLTEVMDALVAIVQRETELVRAGRLGEAAQLAQQKTDLTRLYIADVMRLRDNGGRLTRLIPEGAAALRKRHDTFRALLQINLTVLATAHAVSEGIVRGVSGELARKSAPQTYGASGHPTLPARSAAPALAISRTM